MARHTLSVLVNNHMGVLSRVAGLFSRRGYNIESLSVGATEDSNISRMTIIMECEDDVYSQIRNQLAKLMDVVKITEFKDEEFIDIFQNCTVAFRNNLLWDIELSL